MALSWPVEGTISQYFGTNPASYQPNGHTGVDFAIPAGTPVYAADSGNIIFEGWATTLSASNPWWIAPAAAGIAVLIDHNDGYISVYGHLSGTSVNNGDFVEKGQLIGHSGNTGMSTGPHLHFEVMGWPLKPYNGYYGRLNPHNGLVNGFSAAAATVAGHQRISSAPVNQRTAANRSASAVKTFPAETILDFKGYVRGEDVDGNSIWYVGAYSDTYFWSGGFTDSSTNGLADLTPAPVAAPAPSLSPSQRKVGSAVIRYRKAPNTSAEVIIEYQPGDVLTFSQWTRGQDVSGNNIWFKGALSGGYAWSGGFEDQSTNGLTEEAASTTPVPVTPEPAPVVEKYSFAPDFDFVEVIPVALVAAPNEKFTFGSFPDKPECAVIHQFGTLGRDTIGSLINTFTNPTARQASAHFAISGKRIVQMVSLKDRAYHAGPQGNNWIGIETDPAQDADTIASTKKLLAALKEKYGYELKTILHKEVPEAKTNCGDSITLSNYKLDVVETPIIVIPVPPSDPAPTDIPETPVVVIPTPPATVDNSEEIIDEFLAELRKVLLLLRK